MPQLGDLDRRCGPIVADWLGSRKLQAKSLHLSAVGTLRLQLEAKVLDGTPSASPSRQPRQKSFRSDVNHTLAIESAPAAVFSKRTLLSVYRWATVSGSRMTTGIWKAGRLTESGMAGDIDDSLSRRFDQSSRHRFANAHKSQSLRDSQRSNASLLFHPDACWRC